MNSIRKCKTLFVLEWSACHYSAPGRVLIPDHAR